MPMKYCSSLFTKYGIFTLLYLKKISFTTMELNKRWEMFVFSGFLLNRCCKNEKYKSVHMKQMSEGFCDATQGRLWCTYVQWHVFEWIDTCKCCLCDAEQHSRWTLKCEIQLTKLTPDKVHCVCAIIKIISKCLLSSSKDIIPYKLSKAIKNL